MKPNLPAGQLMGLEQQTFGSEDEGINHFVTSHCIKHYFAKIEYTHICIYSIYIHIYVRVCIFIHVYYG